jgi:hypothetical protein
VLSFLFPYIEPLRVGEYLMGSPKWTDAVSLRNARIMCLAGEAVAPTVLQLEVDGELIEKTIPVLPLLPGERINSVVALNRVLPPGSELRIKCVRAPRIEEDCIREVGVNLEATVASTWEPLTPSGGSDLYVMWINGQEQMRLFDYQPASASGTCLFTESVPGRAAGRASILNGPDCEIQIQGEAVLQIASDQILHCGWFTAIGGTGVAGGSATGEPRLEFWRGWQGHLPPQRLASLTKSGQLVTVDLSEVASLAGGSGSATGLGFTFLGNGAPAAVIGPVKCTALGLKEGWISPFDRLTSDGIVRVTDDGARRVVIH